MDDTMLVWAKRLAPRVNGRQYDCFAIVSRRSEERYVGIVICHRTDRAVGPRLVTSPIRPAERALEPTGDIRWRRFALFCKATSGAISRTATVTVSASVSSLATITTPYPPRLSRLRADDNKLRARISTPYLPYPRIETSHVGKPIPLGHHRNAPAFGPVAPLPGISNRADVSARDVGTDHRA